LKKDVFISVVSPVYQAEKIIQEFIQQVKKELVKITTHYEIILVEDCGPDNSWEVIKNQCSIHPFVKGIRLSRNFGQHYAISAGIKKAKGDNIVLMDCDLQDNPKDIIKLFNERKKGFEIIFTKRLNRKHSIMKSFNSFLYNKLFTIFSEKKYNVDTGSLVLFSKKVADEFNKLEEKDRLYIQLLKWVGFKTTTVEVEHNERYEGESSYNFIGLLKLGIQGWTSHSNKLLLLNIYIGLTLSFLSFLGGFLIVLRHYFYEFQLGWPSIIVTILFSTGLILSSIGIVGIYIGKIFEQAKNKPLYIIDEEINIF
tara:strand:- start:2545 stop:3477 length:933 start_codon:yes stop_codon:yes gene_type:complete